MKTCLLFLFLLPFMAKISAQTDTIPPTILCKQTPINVNVTPTGMIMLWAGATFYDTLYDNESGNIELGIRKVCTGTGFPSDTFVSYHQPGYYAVDLWARDEAGNAASCQAIVAVVDNGSLEYDGLMVSAKTEATDGVEEADIELRGYHCYYDSFLYQSNIDGLYSFGIPEPGSNFTLTPYKDENPLNGVTTYDLVLISKHILGIEPLGSPYKMIAADANHDGHITTFDIIILRKLILGITQELPFGESWRFLPEGYVFPNPQDPFNPPFPENIIVPFVTDPPQTQYKFIALKVGDVNNTAVANSKPVPKQGH